MKTPQYLHAYMPGEAGTKKLTALPQMEYGALELIFHFFLNSPLHSLRFLQLTQNGRNELIFVKCSEQYLFQSKHYKNVCY